MKALWLMMLLAPPLTPTAQFKASPAQASDLSIVAYKLGPIVRVDVSPNDPPPELDRQSSVAAEINPPRYEWQAKAELEIQNTGTRRRSTSSSTRLWAAIRSSLSAPGARRSETCVWPRQVVGPKQ